MPPRRGRSTSRGGERQHIIDTFRRFDENGDGVVSRDELVHVFRRLDPSFDTAAIDGLIQEMDKNKDGKIQYEELISWLTSVGTNDGDRTIYEAYVSNASNVPKPTYWTTTANCNLVSCPERIAEFQDLVSKTWRIKYTRDRKLADASGRVPSGARVLNVLRVENHPRFEKYWASLMAIRHRGGCERFPVQTECFATLSPLILDVNEMYLFHGTNPIAADAIARTDFDMDRCGSAVGTMFGPGIYLAENASKSDEYAREGDGVFMGQCALLLCRALAGRVYNVEEKGDQSHAVKSGKYDCVCVWGSSCRLWNFPRDDFFLK